MSIEIIDIPAQIDDREVFAQLGYPRDRSPEGIALDHYTDLKKQALHGLVGAKAAFSIFPVADLPDRDLFSGAQQVALCILTIGPELESEVSRLADSDLERSVILDAIGSSAAEQAAETAYQKILAQAGELSATMRFSPGYCTWKLEDQDLIFSRLPAAGMGVQLSPSYMMIPRKSISFAVNLGSEADMDMRAGLRSCSACEKLDCPYNKTPKKEKK